MDKPKSKKKLAIASPASQAKPENKPGMRSAEARMAQLLYIRSLACPTEAHNHSQKGCPTEILARSCCIAAKLFFQIAREEFE